MDGRKIITAGLIPVLAVMCGMLCGASHIESPLPQPRAVTLRDKVMQVRETYGVKFVYDSTIDLDLPYTGGPAGKGEGLEEALDRIFGGSGIEWRRRRGHIVLVHGEPRELRDSIGTVGPGNQAVERRDTITESRISTDRYRREVNRTQTGLEHIDGRRFNSGFAFFSSPDVIKTLQNLPGVASGTELLSGLYVHGGTGSDNLFLLDGVPLYNVSHLAGLFSSFNTDVVESLDFYKSGFPARYGGRLSSVVDVKTRDGDFEDYHGVFSIGLIDGRLQYEGPIVKGKTSFNVAMRRTWMDAFLSPVLKMAFRKERDTKYDASYSFYDLNARLTHRFSPDSRLSLNFYSGRDGFRLSRMGLDDTHSDGERTLYNTNTSRYRWGSLTASLNWHYRISGKTDMDLVAYYTRSPGITEFSSDSFAGEDGETALASSEKNISMINDFGLRADFGWRPSEKHYVRYGAGYQFHRYSPSREYLRTSTTQGERSELSSSGSHMLYHGHEPSVYIEDEITFSPKFSANIGLRYAMFIVPDKIWHGVEPRAALKYTVSPSVSLKASYTEMNQFNHSISALYIDLPAVSWMPSTGKIRPMHSRQTAAGVYLELPYNLHLDLEGFYKTMDNIMEYSGLNSIFPPLDRWESSFISGKGRAYGAELDFGYRTASTRVDLYYTLSWSQRYFESIFPGWYPDRNDNRHKITVVATHSLSDRIDFYMAWNYHSGNRVTVPDQALKFKSQWSMTEWYYPVYSRPNNARHPDYHRLDFGMNIHKTTRKGRENVWNVSFYNVYCRMNAVFASISSDSNGKYYGRAVGIFPLVPSFSYTLKF